MPSIDASKPTANDNSSELPTLAVRINGKPVSKNCKTSHM
jgi:hypothetical protein